MAGAGFFAQFQAEAWNRISDVRIAAVADPDAERAQEFASRWNIDRTYASVEDMVERERPDFIDIVTRPDTHVVLTEVAASAGVQVICQKPMAPTAEDSRRMVEACERSGVRLLVHENWRWQPWYRETKRLVDAGATGRVFHLAFRMRTGDGRGSEPYTVQPYFRQMTRLLIFETVVHFLDTFRYLAGEIDRVYCSLQTVNPIIAGEDYGVVHLRFESGAQGLIDANRISGWMPPEVAFGELRLEGERAAIRMSPEGSLFLTEYGRAETVLEFPKPDSGYKGDSVFALQQHFADCLKNGRPAESEGRTYLRTVDLVEACYRSAESGMPVDLHY